MSLFLLKFNLHLIHMKTFQDGNSFGITRGMVSYSN